MNSIKQHQTALGRQACRPSRRALLTQCLHKSLRPPSAGPITAPADVVYECLTLLRRPDLESLAPLFPHGSFDPGVRRIGLAVGGEVVEEAGPLTCCHGFMDTAARRVLPGHLLRRCRVLSGVHVGGTCCVMRVALTARAGEEAVFVWRLRRVGHDGNPPPQQQQQQQGDGCQVGGPPAAAVAAAAPGLLGGTGGSLRGPPEPVCRSAPPSPEGWGGGAHHLNKGTPRGEQQRRPDPTLPAPAAPVSVSVSPGGISGKEEEEDPGSEGRVASGSCRRSKSSGGGSAAYERPPLPPPPALSTTSGGLGLYSSLSTDGGGGVATTPHPSPPHTRPQHPQTHPPAAVVAGGGNGGGVTSWVVESICRDDSQDEQNMPVPVPYMGVAVPAAAAPAAGGWGGQWGPHPRCSPELVVLGQLAALRRGNVGAAACFNVWSRSTSGGWDLHLNAFRAMLRQPSYHVLLTSDGAELGPSALTSGRRMVQEVRVLTSRSSANGSGGYGGCSFVYQLCMEANGCWLVEGIRPVSS